VILQTVALHWRRIEIVIGCKRADRRKSQ